MRVSAAMLIIYFSIIITYIYGVYLSFCAHVVIGLASILIPGSAFIIGLASYFGMDIPAGILELIQ